MVIFVLNRALHIFQSAPCCADQWQDYGELSQQHKQPDRLPSSEAPRELVNLCLSSLQHGSQCLAANSMRQDFVEHRLPPPTFRDYYSFVGVRGKTAQLPAARVARNL